MRVYSAKSVKVALEKMEKQSNHACEGLDKLVCPAPHLLLEALAGCTRRCDNVAPSLCPSARKRSCKRVVHIYNNKAKTRLYCALFLYFTISDKSREGFIDAEDNPVKALIRKGDILLEDLDCLEI
jgi:hypothetical protein